MRHLIVAAMASLGVAGFVTTGTAKAQVGRPGFPGAGSPYSTPGLSPYLNLLQRGNPAINYYGLVRPQQGYNYAINSLEQAVTANRVAATAAENLAAPATGHQVSFLNYRRFFLNTGAASTFQNLQATAGAGGTGTTGALGAAAARPGFGAGGFGGYGGYGGVTPFGSAYRR
jgi:hypothetical protein